MPEPAACGATRWTKPAAKSIKDTDVETQAVYCIHCVSPDRSYTKYLALIQYKWPDLFVDAFVSKIDISSLDYSPMIYERSAIIIPNRARNIQSSPTRANVLFQMTAKQSVRHDDRNTMTMVGDIKSPGKKQRLVLTLVTSLRSLLLWNDVVTLFSF